MNEKGGLGGSPFFCSKPAGEFSGVGKSENMGYSTGMLKHRVEVLKRVQEDGEFGIRSGKPSFERVCCVWADVTWKKGQKSLNAGAMDDLDTVMFRMRWDGRITRECFLMYDGVVYQVMQFHADRQDNTIQILATEIVTK